MNSVKKIFNIFVVGGDPETKYYEDFYSLLMKHVYNETNLLRYFKYLECIVFQNRENLNTKYEHINLYANMLEEYAFTENVIQAFGTVQNLINFLNNTLELQEHFFKSIVKFHAVTLNYRALEIRNEDDVTYHCGDFNTSNLWNELGSYCHDNNVLFDLILFDKSTVKFTSFTVQTLRSIASLLNSNGIVYIEDSNSKTRYINLYGYDTEDKNKFSALVDQVNDCNYNELFNCMIGRNVKMCNFVTENQIPLLLGGATTNYVLDDPDHLKIATEFNHLEIREYKEMMLAAKEMFKCYVDQYNTQIFNIVFDAVEYCEGSYIDNNTFPIRSYYVLGHVKGNYGKQCVNYRELLAFANV